MSGSPSEQQGTAVERQIARIRQGSTSIALVASGEYAGSDSTPNLSKGSKGKMATQADVDAFWTKAALHLKPSFDLVVSKNAAHVDKELLPIKTVLSDHTTRLETMNRSLDEVKTVLEDIRRKLG